MGFRAQGFRALGTFLTVYIDACMYACMYLFVGCFLVGGGRGGGVLEFRQSLGSRCFWFSHAVCQGYHSGMCAACRT